MRVRKNMRGEKSSSITMKTRATASSQGINRPSILRKSEPSHRAAPKHESILKEELCRPCYLNHLPVNGSKLTQQVGDAQHLQLELGKTSRCEDGVKATPHTGIQAPGLVKIEPSSSQKAKNPRFPVDLTLRLSPPKEEKIKQEDHPAAPPVVVQPTEPFSPAPSPPLSCMSQDHANPNPNGFNQGGLTGGPEEAAVLLVLMGCKNCYLYAMVPENNPKCPKCKSARFLVDDFRGSPPKKMKKSNI